MTRHPVSLRRAGGGSSRQPLRSPGNEHLPRGYELAMSWRAGNGSHGTPRLTQSLPTTCRPPLHLHEPFLQKLAPFAGNFVALSRATDNATPAFGDEFRVNSKRLEAVAKSAVHAWNREPHFGPLKF